jgi:hypothetical protein
MAKKVACESQGDQNSSENIIRRGISHDFRSLRVSILRAISVEGSVLFCNALWSPKEFFVFSDSHAELLSSGFDSRKETISSGEGAHVSDCLGDQLLSRLGQTPMVGLCRKIDRG